MISFLVSFHSENKTSPISFHISSLLIISWTSPALTCFLDYYCHISTYQKKQRLQFSKFPHNVISTIFHGHNIFVRKGLRRATTKTPSNHTLHGMIIRRKQHNIDEREWGDADWMIKNLCNRDLQIDTGTAFVWWNCNHFEIECELPFRHRYTKVGFYGIFIFVLRVVKKCATLK